MLKTVRRMGDHCLLQVSTEVATTEFNTVELDQLILDMHDTQIKYGGVGIAAPQIGVNKRVIIIEYYQKDITRYSDIGDCPLRVIINPQFSVLNEQKSTFNEGCLSLPGLRGPVTRPTTISYQFYDQFGNLHQGQDNGFFARVLQHECDHLDGILYPMRMDDISQLAFVEMPTE